MRRMIILAVAFFMVTIPISAQATIIAQDSFDYSPGSLGGNSGGTGWSGAWTGDVSVLDGGSLSYTDSGGRELVTNGNRVTAPGFSYRSLGRELQNEDVWISFLIDRDFINIMWAGISLYNDGDEYLFMGKIGNSDQLGLHEWHGINRMSPIENDSLDAVFFVSQLSFSSSGTEWYAWLNPDLNTIPDTSTADAHNTHPNLSVVDQIRIAGETGIEFDELRIGTTYSDVAPVPEPATVLLIGTGLVGLMGFRRKFKA